MSLNPGDQICYRLMPEIFRYTAGVQSDDEHVLVLRLADDAPETLAAGNYVMITEPETDIEHYTEVVSRNGAALELKRLWTGKRGYFRVDDVFPVLCRKATGSPLPESRLFTGFGGEFTEMETPDETVSPRLWKMLTDMNAKLNQVLERLNLEREGIAGARSVPVNISASGVRLALPDRPGLGDVMELKMLLPVYPPVGVFAHGAVVRVEEADQGMYRCSLHFLDLSDEVRDAIIQYTLKRQRDMMRKQRDR